MKKIAAALLLIASLIILRGITSFYSERILPGVWVGNLSLGGLLPEEAGRRLTELAWAEAERSVKLLWEGEVLEAKLGALGFTVDVEGTLARAWAIGHTGPWWLRLRALCPGKRYPINLVYHHQKDRTQACLENLLGPLRVEPQDARWELDDRGGVRLVPARDGWVVDVEALWAFLEKWSSGEAREPLPVPVRKVAPRIATEEMAQRGIAKVVSRSTTYFNPDEENRSHNIRLAAQALDGKWLEPGGELSFNQIVGPRTEERGYREALVIESMNFTPGVGGGVCQVSTTLYNAALHAGLTVIERQPHALRVDYAPPGLDATVAYGLIDLRLRNDTPYWYWIKAVVRDETLTFTFYGPQGAPRIEITSEILEKIPPPQEIKPDPTLPAGKTFTEREGRWGYRVRVKRRWNLEERVWEEIVSQDYYAPVPRVVRQGIE
ncbi:MAG: VanW family protein [Moorellaceae bacterium]